VDSILYPVSMSSLVLLMAASLSMVADISFSIFFERGSGFQVTEFEDSRDLYFIGLQNFKRGEQ